MVKARGLLEVRGLQALRSDILGPLREEVSLHFHIHRAYHPA